MVIGKVSLWNPIEIDIYNHEIKAILVPVWTCPHIATLKSLNSISPMMQIILVP